MGRRTFSGQLVESIGTFRTTRTDTKRMLIRHLGSRIRVPAESSFSRMEASSFVARSESVRYTFIWPATHVLPGTHFFP